MYEPYWRLRYRPFRVEGGVESYVPSPAHDEALARLNYLVEANHRVGLLLGAMGTGKSLLFGIAAQEWRRIGASVVCTSLRAKDSRETLHSIARGWDAAVDLHAPTFELWHSIADKLAENRWQQVPTLALFDDADRAADDVLDQVMRLAHCEPTADSRLTVVLAAQGHRRAATGRHRARLVCRRSM